MHLFPLQNIKQYSGALMDGKKFRLQTDGQIKSFTLNQICSERSWLFFHHSMALPRNEFYSNGIF